MKIEDMINKVHCADCLEFMKEGDSLFILSDIGNKTLKLKIINISQKQVSNCLIDYYSNFIETYDEWNKGLLWPEQRLKERVDEYKIFLELP